MRKHLLNFWHRKFKNKFKGKNFVGATGISVAIALAHNFIMPDAIYSADQIRFWFAPFGEFTIYIDDLEQFVQQGSPNRRLEIYLGQLSKIQQDQVRELLSRRYEISHTTVANFTYSDLGETLVKQMDAILQSSPNQNGFSALRSALILSAQSDEGLSAINILRKYPLPVIHLDLSRGLQFYEQLSRLTDKKDAVFAAIQKQASAETKNIAALSKYGDIPEADLRIAGSWQWDKARFTYWQRDRKIQISADIYIPKTSNYPAPLIVISHGLGSNPDTFRYLAEHLASYGFAVAVLEHPYTSSRELNRFLSKLDTDLQFEEAIQLPRDITYLIDAIDVRRGTDHLWRDRINTGHVGLIGHSLGGYTVLALAGAQVNPQQISRACDDAAAIALNIAKLFQCRFKAKEDREPMQRFDLSDRRVKSVIVLNPLGGSTLLGQEGMQNIKIPIAVFSGGNDLLTPAIDEQILPFVWISSSAKYLIAFPKGTHFSFLEKAERGVVVLPDAIFGESPQFTHPYVRALGVAFFQVHLNDVSRFASYLTNSYLQTIASSQFPAFLITRLNFLSGD